jgi:hypothetical protein
MKRREFIAGSGAWWWRNNRSLLGQTAFAR